MSVPHLGDLGPAVPVRSADRRAERGPAILLLLVLPAMLSCAPARGDEPIQPARDTMGVEAERCAAAVDDDEVRPYTPALHRALADAFADSYADVSVKRDAAPDERALRSAVWRCMDRHLVGCLIGAGRPCGKMSTMRRNPGADGFCRAHPGGEAAPPAASGDDSIYEWRCAGGLAVIARTAYRLDARGFALGSWRRLE